MRVTGDKDVNDLIAQLIELGWGYSKNKHLKLIPPFAGGYVFIALTPSDYRALMNIQRGIRRMYRKAGLQVPEFL